MNSIFKFEKKTNMKKAKYVIFSVLFSVVIFAFMIFNVKITKAAELSIKVNHSNHEGNNEKSSANEAIGPETLDPDGEKQEKRYFVQGTGVELKDVVSLTFTNIPAGYDAIALVESGYNMSNPNGEKRNYDSYKFNGNQWKSDASTSAGVENTVTNSCSTGVSADDATLRANRSDNTGPYAIFCMNGTTLEYAYTIRNEGYGLKTIHVFFYDSESNLSVLTPYAIISIVVSKPISEFNRDAAGSDASAGFAWNKNNLDKDNLVLDYTGETANNNMDGCETHVSATGRPSTSMICGIYQNETVDENLSNQNKTMHIVIPKEVAYSYNLPSSFKSASGAGSMTVEEVLDQSIYAINTFRNSGNVGVTNGKYVAYYYYKFALEEYTMKTGTTGSNILSTTVSVNEEMKKMKQDCSYLMSLEVDALGSYSFYITDLFGNKFESYVENDDNDDWLEGDVVQIKDVSKRDILVDYTNADLLTILDAVIKSETNATLGAETVVIKYKNYAGGTVAEVAYNTSGAVYKVMYVKMQKVTKVADGSGISVTVDIEIFTKVKIDEGIYYDKDEYHTDNGTMSDRIEPIRKQAIVKDDVSTVQWWKDESSDFTDSSRDDGEAVIYSKEEVSCETTKTFATTNGCKWMEGNSVINENYNSSGYYNRLELKVFDNARFRISVTDRFGNTTSDNTGVLMNPYVDVTIIDSQIPTIKSTNNEIETSKQTSIETYAYVNGGGEKQVKTGDDGKVNLMEAQSKSYSEAVTNNAQEIVGIYYTNKGTKFFNYSDLISILKLKAEDITVGNTYSITYDEGIYTDNTRTLLSDRNTSSTTAAYGGQNDLQMYILKNNLTTFSGGLVRPTESYDISVDASGNVTFVMNSTTYTISYTNAAGKVTDTPVSVNNGVGDVTNRMFSKDGTQYMIIGKQRVVSYSATTKSAIEVPVYGASYTMNSSSVFTDATKEDYNTIGQYVDTKDHTGDYKFVETLNSTLTGITYQNFLGFIEIDFYDDSDALICSLRENATENSECFLKMNKRIDTVADFKVKVRAFDYVGNKSDESADLTYTIKVIDTTAPGFLTEFEGQSARSHKKSESETIEIKWSNVFTGSQCMLEIGNKVQSKETLLDCYKLAANISDSDAANDKYHYIDNDTSHTTYDSANKAGTQWYEMSNPYDNYFDNIILEIEGDSDEDGDGEIDFITIDGSEEIELNKAQIHELRITIEDNWDKFSGTANSQNKIQISLEYYVNPRVLLIEPIASEKIYGEADKANFEFCVYINKDNTTFSETDKFFNVSFVEENFKLAYCSIDTSDPSAAGRLNNILATNSGNLQEGVTISNITDPANVLLNKSVFTGALSRVESEWYNEFVGYKQEGQTTINAIYSDTDNKLTGADKTQNNYVGYYNLVLGTLGIHKTLDSDGNTNAVCGAAEYGCDKDYVVKIDPRKLILGEGKTLQDYRGDTPAAIVAQTMLEVTQTQNKVPHENDGQFTESSVQLTIKQSILEVTANGGSKTFGEMDSNSHNWNSEDTERNSSSSTGYLNGYTITGFKNATNGNTQYYFDNIVVGADSYIVKGVLRRQVGEEAGRYFICNVYSNMPTKDICSSVDELEDIAYAPGAYSTNSGETYMFAAYTNTYGLGYGLGGENNNDTKAALEVQTNEDIYDSHPGKRLNLDNRNYVIEFTGNIYTINSNDIVVQPGINQGKEYSKDKYRDPVWQMVVYGEAISNSAGRLSSDGTWSTNIVVEGTDSDPAFSGYTQAIYSSMPETDEVNFDTYQTVGTGYTKDSSIYYSRRKTTPADTGVTNPVTYLYEVDVDLSVNGVYTMDGDYYFKTGTSSCASGTCYTYAFGGYYGFTASDVTSGKVRISVLGHLVNETYQLFESEGNGVGSAKLSRELQTDDSGHVVGWYKFNAIDNMTTTFKVVDVARSEAQCTITATDVTVASIEDTGTFTKCRNYTLKYETSAPDKHKKSDGTDAGTVDEVARIITQDGVNNEYKPDGINGCTNADVYTAACIDGKKTEVLFEIFKRELVISFDASKYTFTYGQRYDYYDGGSNTINSNNKTSTNKYFDVGTYNQKDGIFKIDNNSSEGDIFVCYNEHNVAVTCTNNDDYGITKGDTWTNIGLEFFMNPLIAKTDSSYYDSGEDRAIPAGTYYIYANISQAAKENYKFTYLGGTLTIAPKVTSVQLTSYTKEYGEENYASYGLGTDYSNFSTEFASSCVMKDSEYESSSDGLINLGVSCGATGNIVGNMYGFQIEGLDSKDTISNNFTGRPKRDTGEDVGYYKINVNNIETIQSTIVQQKGIETVAIDSYTADPFSAAYLNDNGYEFKSGLNSTITYYGTDAANVVYNYDIDQSLENNEGAYLFITPALIDVTVAENQTKMYGCAYSYYNTNQNYNYTIANGYSSNPTSEYAGCDSSSTALDIAYKYTVKGDKDVGSDYTVETTLSLDGNGTKTTNYTIDGHSGEENTSLIGSLYRVLYSSDALTYEDFFVNSEGNFYQGQHVGDYIITLGDLNARPNGNTSMCDAFNNPSVTGDKQCRNYNINYYGNSASKDNLVSNTTQDERNNEHKYVGTTTVQLADLQTYDLNYVNLTLGVATGKYVYINGKYINIASQAASSQTIVNRYVKVQDVQLYEKNKEYVVNNTTGEYIYIHNQIVVLADGSTETQSGYIKYNTLKNFGTESNWIINVNGKDIPISIINRYGKSSTIYSEAAAYNPDVRQYIKLGNDYVALDSLNRYSKADEVYTKNSSGDYVLIYYEINNTLLHSDLTTAPQMYVKRDDGTGAYVFVNGSYVLKSSLNPDADGNIVVNSAVKRNADGTNVDVQGNQSVDANGISTNVKFTITRRDVHIHTEYDVIYIGNEEISEKIKCSQISAAYGLNGDFTNRSYCAGVSEGDYVELGTARYYAVDNSLAKFPWTGWTDTVEGGVTLANITLSPHKPEAYYNDTQFDVVLGKVSRQTGDLVGKYVYDYGDIEPNLTATYGNGENYVIKIATSTDFDHTYIAVNSSGQYIDKNSEGVASIDINNSSVIKMSLTEYFAQTGVKKYDSAGVELAVNGYYIKDRNGQLKSLSFAEKYWKDADGNYVPIDYWYLGFYDLDGSEGRSGELAMWRKYEGANPIYDKEHGFGEIFEEPYTNFVAAKEEGNSTILNRLKSKGYVNIYDEDLSEGREVYFEIVRKTIYLYSVDLSKIYGTPDKYSNFKVAICASDNGYTVEADGSVRCNDTNAAISTETHGLTTAHMTSFYETVTDGSTTYYYMKQNAIKGDTDGKEYAFIGSGDDSMQIYFKRNAGEDVGIYSVTACALQTGISDCSDPAQEEGTKTATNTIGDNYRIIEIAGTLTVNTREITIVPDSGQGFQYGNYPNDGDIPAITYKEYFEYVSSSNTGSQGMVNSDTSDSSHINSTVASCFIDVSGDSIICINDNQNKEQEFSDDVNDYILIGDFAHLLNNEQIEAYINKAIGKGVTPGFTDQHPISNKQDNKIEFFAGVQINNIYGDTYSHPDRANEREEDETRYALNRMCGATDGLRDSRDACNYIITDGELEEGSQWSKKEFDQYVRIVKSNVFVKNADDTYTLYTTDTGYDANGKYLKVGERYFPIVSGARYNYDYKLITANNEIGSYIKIDEVYYKMIDANRYQDSSCNSRSVYGTYYKEGTSACVKINGGDGNPATTNENTYNLSKYEMKQNNQGPFLYIKYVDDTDTNTYDYNYTIKEFSPEGDVYYEITAAELTMNPVEDQFKIYGDKDPEIKFTVQTKYVVKSDHYIEKDNVVSIVRSGETDDIKETVCQYTSYKGATGSGTKTHCLVEAGATVILRGYAYKENMPTTSGTTNEDGDLDYGVNYANVKHGQSAGAEVLQSVALAKHYDTHIQYEQTNKVSTSRILIGNFYVTDYDQNVGEKNYISGFIVAINSLAYGDEDDDTQYRNYFINSTGTNANAAAGVFTIVPRPIYIEIDPITKMYGQATDIESCDSGVTCELGTGILSNGEQYMKYNFHVNTHIKTDSIITTLTGSGKKVGDNTVYNADSIIGSINLPTAVGAVSADYSALAVTNITGENKYYTEGKNQETKNDHLDIIVQRGNYNAGDGNKIGGACYVSGEVPISGTGKGCEDAGVYYTRFAGTNVNTSGQIEMASEPSEVSSFYFDDYWGYNTNYYAVIENDINDTEINDTELEKDTTTNKDTYIPMFKPSQERGSTLTINKKPISIVVETFSFEEANGGRNIVDSVIETFEGELGEIYGIEQNSDVPVLPTIDNDLENKTQYKKIAWALQPAQVRTADALTGYVAYYPVAINTSGADATNPAKKIVQTAGECVSAAVGVTSGLDCSTNALIYHYEGGNNANTGPNVFDTSVAGYYAITRDKNVLYMTNTSWNNLTQLTATPGLYEDNNYETTFINGILVIDEDTRAPVIFAGSEYYAINANNGTTTEIGNTDEDTTYKYLNKLINNDCSAITGKANNSVPGCTSNKFTPAIHVAGDRTFSLNNYKYKINENLTQVVGVSDTNQSYNITNTSGKYTVTMGDSNTYTIIVEGASNAPVLLARPNGDTATDKITEIEMSSILRWFNITSHDPSVVRAGANIPKRYDARYYIAIDENFNQRVVGSYTVFIYAIDNVGNISRATTVTLNVKDITNPVTGTLNLYEGKIVCAFDDEDCVGDESAWKDATNTSNDAKDHIVWSNNINGIWMNVIGGEDNSINYLKIENRKRFNLAMTTADDLSTITQITENSNGIYILLGTMLNIDNMTQYYKQGNYYIVKDPQGTYADGTTFYIRYKGEYKDISTLKRYVLSSGSYNVDTNGYITGGDYGDVYFVDGEFFKLPQITYNIDDDTNKITQVEGRSGAYIKLDQWDHYFSRDNGATWIKYDRENVNGYLALESDGQRLIMIKAVDKGIEYAVSDATNAVDSSKTDGTHYNGTYLKNTASGTEWVVDPITPSPGYKEYKTGTAHHNVSDWEEDNSAAQYYRDRKYAYLDTQRPIVTLDENGFWIFEYGCENCTNGYSEEYGKSIDSYFLPIGTFNRVNSDGTANNTGDYIKVPIKTTAGKDDFEIISLANRKYAKSNTAINACVGKYIDSTDDTVKGCYSADPNGDFVYVGTIVDGGDYSVDKAATITITNTFDSTTIKVNANVGAVNLQEQTATIKELTATELNNPAEKILITTIYNISGLSGTNVMAGTQNIAKDIETIDHVHKKIVVFLTVSDPYDRGNSVSLTDSLYGVNGIFGTAAEPNKVTTYYRFEITCDADAINCEIKGKASTTDQSLDSATEYSGITINDQTNSFVEGATTEDKLNVRLIEAINTIITDELASKVYNPDTNPNPYAGKNLTYSINYTTTDMAGNISKTQTRGVIFSNFLEAVGVTVQTPSGATQALYSSYEVDVAQNNSATSVLQNFRVTTSKSSTQPQYNDYLIQTIYYNNQLIAEEQRYNENTLANLDTSVPGVYRIVYSTKRLHNGEIVRGTPFELTINVKPTVADVSVVKADYKQIVITAFIASSIIVMLAYVYIATKKKKV